MRQWVFGILLCLFFQAQAGGPWAAGKGHGYAQAGATFNRYSSIFYDNQLGKLQLNRWVTDNTYQFYGEYGISNKFTVIANLPFKALNTEKQAEIVGSPPPTPLPAGKVNGFGNISVAGKYSFWDKYFNMAAQVIVESPSNRIDNEAGIRTGYGAWSVTPSIMIGKGLKKFYGFVNLGVALRSSGYSEDFMADIELGYTPFKRAWIAAVFNNKNPFLNGEVIEGNVRETSLYVNNQAYNAFGLKLAYGITEKLGVNGSAYGAFSGNLVAAAPTFNASIYYKW
ncbi:MAG: hypothetical protein ACKVTZ_24375 [Bacteroidia bacterium]